MKLDIKIKREDNKKIQLIKFNVPKGCRKIAIKKHYKHSTELELKTKIDLCFYDSENKFYGRLDRYKEELIIDETNNNGSILPGKWTVSVEAFAVYNNLKITLEFDYDVSEKFEQYTGELHVHSDYSDGKLKVKELFEYFSARDYDFVFLTDHNTNQGWKEIENSDGMKIYKGLELTTFNGHILLLGINDFINWYDAKGRMRSIESIYKEVKLKHGLMGIAHPHAYSGLFCAGCRWNYEINPHFFDFIEIWNCKMKNWKANWETIELWFDLLSKGKKIMATAGTDFHKPKDIENSIKLNVLSLANTESHIINSLRLGMFYLSKGEKLELKADDKTFGEILRTNKPINLKYKIENNRNDLSSLYIITRKGLKSIKNLEDSITIDTLEERDFIVLMGTTKERKLSFITNPVFIESL